MDLTSVREPFGEWAKSIQSRLNYEYEASRSVLDQGTILGTIREAVIGDILHKFLPRSVEIGSGQVVDVLGKLSNQIDIVIAENTAPAFRFDGGMSAFLYETVLATIEVKSMLYRDKLHDALDNSKSVKDLTYSLHVRAKGDQILGEAIEWVESAGGLQEIERRIQRPSASAPIGCPEDIWEILPYVRYWLHWKNGDFRQPAVLASTQDILGTAHFDFFTHLLQLVLEQDDLFAALSVDFNRAEEVEEEFLARLYEYLLYENLPPTTFVLAYGGYENISNMVAAVKDWYEQNLGEVEWCQLPRVIMNHRMSMYRHYNEYHCNECDYPILFFMTGICDMLTREFSYPRSIGARSDILPYFDIARILGDEHPKFSPSYLVWSIPLDNSSSGEITVVNEQ